MALLELGQLAELRRGAARAAWRASWGGRGLGLGRRSGGLASAARTPFDAGAPPPACSAMAILPAKGVASRSSTVGLQRYVVNFNPAVEEELRRGRRIREGAAADGLSLDRPILAAPRRRGHRDDRSIQAKARRA